MNDVLFSNFMRLADNAMKYLMISSETFFRECEVPDEELVVSEIRFPLMLRVAIAVMKRQFSKAMANLFFEFARAILTLLESLSENELNGIEFALLLFFRVFTGLSAETLMTQFSAANLEDKIGVLLNFLFASIDKFDSLIELAVSVLPVFAKHESPRFSKDSVVIFPLFFEDMQRFSSSSSFFELVIVFNSRDADRSSQFISSLLSQLEGDILDHRIGLLFYFGLMFQYAHNQATFNVFLDLLQPTLCERFVDGPAEKGGFPFCTFRRICSQSSTMPERRRSLNLRRPRKCSRLSWKM
jgi:hypothetical protein